MRGSAMLTQPIEHLVHAVAAQGDPQPTGMPSRSLKLAMDLRARVMAGFCPVISAELVDGLFQHLGVRLGLAHAHVQRDLGDLAAPA